MTALLFALTALAGGCGAVARFALDGAIRARLTSEGRSRLAGALPWGTVLINVSGSFALGALAGLAASGAAAAWHAPALTAVLGTGFLGGFTTFSTACVETVRLLQEGRWRASAANGLGVLVAGTAAAAAGLSLGTAL